MDIPGPQSLLNLSLPRLSPQAMVDSWKIGQILQATALSTSRNGTAIIAIGGTAVSAQLSPQTPVPLQAGQQLQLEVSTLANLAMLKLLDSRPQSEAVTLRLPALGHLLTGWQQGRVIEALLLNRPGAQQALLEIAGQRLQAQVSGNLSSVALAQALKLEILDPGKIAALRILTQPTEQDGIRQALRSVLPQQGPLAPLLASLLSLAKPTAGQPRNTMPPALTALVQDIVNRLPTSTSAATAEGLQRAIAQSGLFLEANLAQAVLQGGSSGRIIPDFKSGLLSLLNALFTLGKSAAPPSPAATTTVTPQPPLPTLMPLANPAQAQIQHTVQNPAVHLPQVLQELLRQVETGLARLQVAQLSSSGTEDDGKRGWLVELPIRHDDRIHLFQCRIEREGGHPQRKAPAAWSINLSFDLETLGPIQAHISLLNGIIHTRFQAQHPQTVALIEEHQTLLLANYRKAGLTVGSFNTQLGITQSAPMDLPPLPEVLLDIKV